MGLRVHALDSGQAVATLGPLVIRVITSARTEIADIDRLAALTQEILTRSPVAGMWIVVHHGAPVLDRATRRHAGRVLEAFEAPVVVGYALLGLGFWASAAIAATAMFSRVLGVRAAIETDLERSAQRLGMELIGLDPDRLVAIHDELFERIQPGRSLAHA